MKLTHGVFADTFQLGVCFEHNGTSPDDDFKSRHFRMSQGTTSHRHRCESTLDLRDLTIYYALKFMVILIPDLRPHNDLALGRQKKPRDSATAILICISRASFKWGSMSTWRRLKFCSSHSFKVVFNLPD